MVITAKFYKSLKYWERVRFLGANLSFPKLSFSFESSSFITSNTTHCFPWSDILFIFEKICQNNHNLLFFQVKRMFLKKRKRKTKKVAISVWKIKVFLQGTTVLSEIMHASQILPFYSHTMLMGKDLISLGFFCCFIKDITWNEGVFAASMWRWTCGRVVFWLDAC